MSLKEILFHPAFMDYAEKIKEVRADYEITALTDADPVKIYRAQGAIEALNKILEMPENERIMGEEEGITGGDGPDFDPFNP